MKKKGSILNDNRIVFLISLTFAFLLWMYATNAIDPNASELMHNIPVTVDVQNSALLKLGLDEVQESLEYADVTIEGERMILGTLSTEDVKVSADLTGITAPGEYTVRLIAEDVNDKGFEIVSIEPETVTLKFDRLSSQVFPIDLDVTGIDIPEGYYLENEIILPESITLTGPEAELSKIYTAKVIIDLTQPITKSQTYKVPIEMLDAVGSPADMTHIISDYTTVDVTLPVLKLKEVPLTVSFLNVPVDFPLDELAYTISNETLSIAGPEDRVDNFSELNIGYIDMKNLEPGSTFAFDVTLPSGFVNIASIETVLVEFAMEDYTTRNFNIDNIVVINPPSNFDVTITTPRIANVTMIGPADILEEMTAEDIVAEIDISDSEISVGQISVTANISAPSKGLVWSNGSYSVVVAVTESE